MRTLLIILLLVVIAFSILNKRTLIEGKKNKKSKKKSNKKKKKEKKQDYKRKVKEKSKAKKDHLKDKLKNAKSKKQKRKIKQQIQNQKQKKNDKLSAEKLEVKQMSKTKQEIYKKTKKNNPGKTHDELVQITKDKAEKKRQLDKLAKSRGISKKQARKEVNLARKIMGGGGGSVDLTPYALKSELSGYLEAPLVLDDDFYKTFILTQNQSGIDTWLTEDDDETLANKVQNRKDKVEDQYKNHIRFFTSNITTA